MDTGALVMKNITALLASFGLVGCALLQPMEGDWTMEVEDFDQCELELSIEQDGDELSGEAEIDCVIYTSFYGETYTLNYVGEGDLEGSEEGGEVEIEIEFEDVNEEWSFDSIIEGEVEEGEFEGEIYSDDEILDMEELGDIVGELDD